MMDGFASVEKRAVLEEYIEGIVRILLEIY